MLEVQRDDGSQEKARPDAAGSEDSADRQASHFRDCSADHVPEIVVAHAGGMLVPVKWIGRRDSCAQHAFSPVDARRVVEDCQTHVELMTNLEVNEPEYRSDGPDYRQNHRCRPQRTPTTGPVPACATQS